MGIWLLFNLISIRFDFYSISIRFDSIRFDSIRFDSIRFDSIRFDSTRFDSIYSCTSSDDLAPVLKYLSVIYEEEMDKETIGRREEDKDQTSLTYKYKFNYYFNKESSINVHHQWRAMNQSNPVAIHFIMNQSNPTKMWRANWSLIHW